MAAFVASVALGLVVFVIVADAIYEPRPKPVVVDDAWSAIAKAQKALDDGYRLIYGRSGRE